ncbi:DUF1801 domain-containing protein [Actinomyces radicidentis]|uniref:DUF1801 domain-containing protein n=1 Tax=Actinomyces radicidentis TaxID=111015 RepID=UPI0026DF8ED5|nr:DUF1801 domain-containing protein [Actinomyces radicidentis]
MLPLWPRARSRPSRPTCPSPTSSTASPRAAPGAVEVVSYGLIGYRIGKPRACRMYVSGWKDHGAVYLVPRDEALEAELAPYRHGKGTLWFPLDEPLPRDLLLRTAAFMTRP